MCTTHLWKLLAQSRRFISSMGKKSRKSSGGLSNNDLLLGGGLLLAAWFLFGRKAVAASNLTFYPGGVQSMAFLGATPILTVLVQVQNTSNAQLTINSFSGNVTSNGTLIGNVYNFTPITILPNSMQVVLVTLQLNATGIVNDIVNIFTTRSSKQMLSVNASANVEGIQVPIDLTFQVGS